MTRLISDHDCSSCGDILVLPRASSAKHIPQGTDYICWRCELTHRWVGNPPRLVQIATVVTDDDD
jgi:hypothetical protein